MWSTADRTLPEVLSCFDTMAKMGSNYVGAGWNWHSAKRAAFATFDLEMGCVERAT